MTRTHDEGGDWAPSPIDGHSSREEVEAAVKQWVADGLASLTLNLVNDADLTDRDRAHILTRAARVLQDETRKFYFTKWEEQRAQLVLDNAGNAVH